MSVSAEIAIAQIDAILAEISPKLGDNELLSALREDGMELASMRTRAAATIERLAPSGSRYVADANRKQINEYSLSWAITSLAGILHALRTDYASGYMQTVEELIHADVFADLLEMADELSSKGYKDAAAVIAGSTLESHLRKLASRYSLPVERAGRSVRAATLNDRLAATDDSYSKLTQKTVTAWLDLRNSAAHGHYDEYDQAQVQAMIRDVRAFVDRYPA